jgi:hypothetical protein
MIERSIDHGAAGDYLDLTLYSVLKYYHNLDNKRSLKITFGINDGGL